MMLPCSNLGIAPRARPGRLVPGGHRESVLPWPPVDTLVACDDGLELVASDRGLVLLASDDGLTLLADADKGVSPCQPAP